MCRAALLQQPNNHSHMRATGTIVNRIVIDPESIQKNSRLDDLLSPPNIHTWLGPKSLAICYLLKGAFNVVLTRPTTSHDNDEVFLGPRPADVVELRSFFSNWDPQIRDLLEVAHEFQKWMLLELDDALPSLSWAHSGGKFVLIGDAAHACLPYL